MGATVASAPFHLSQPIVSKAPSASRALASALFASSPCSNRLAAFSAPPSAWLPRFELPKTRPRLVRLSCSASSFSLFSDDEFMDQSEELALRLGNEFASSSSDDLGLDEEENWEDGTNSPGSIERKASCADLPLSVRILKKKLQWKEGFGEAGEAADCSIKTAFGSMVFIVREIQCYALQMRELPLYEDLQILLARVQEDTHASFVWLFQRVFSQTPALMVSLMILLANYSVHSMACSPVVAAPPPTVNVASTVEVCEREAESFDFSSRKAFSVTAPRVGGRSTSVGGRDGGGGGNALQCISGTDGEGHSNYEFPMSSSCGSVRQEDFDLWKAIVEEASEMQAANRGEALDHEMMGNFVSPVTAKVEADEDYFKYLKTEDLYQMGLFRDPNNQLLLANYAQFLYLVAHDHDRAEEYFKKAVTAEQPDAETFNKYATFLWRVKKDLWAAEETFLEAISADPTNSFYAASYAHFLWNTGGEDTCFPISPSDQDNNYPQEA